MLTKLELARIADARGRYEIGRFGIVGAWDESARLAFISRGFGQYNHLSVSVDALTDVFSLLDSSCITNLTRCIDPAQSRYKVRPALTRCH
jgi:hypothetical protein